MQKHCSERPRPVSHDRLIQTYLSVLQKTLLLVCQLQIMQYCGGTNAAQCAPSFPKLCGFYFTLNFAFLVLSFRLISAFLISLKPNILPLQIIHVYVCVYMYISNTNGTSFREDSCKFALSFVQALQFMQQYLFFFSNRELWESSECITPRLNSDILYTVF